MSDEKGRHFNEQFLKRLLARRPDQRRHRSAPEG
jgi:hypothetical protein